MSERPIAVMDSGIGGIPYMQWISSHLPNERIVYLADHAHFPYGSRSKNNIAQIVIEQAERLMEKVEPKIFVLACNSASVSALEPLREAFSLPVVGVVPAVKPAAERASQKVGVLATERTIKDPYLQDLIDHFARGKRVYTEAAPDLVEFVENEILDFSDEAVEEILTPYLKRMLEKEVDSLVLGCTHFTFFEPFISSLTKGKIKPVDSREGVGRQVQRLLKEGGRLAEKKSETDLFYTTRERTGEFYRFLSEKLNIQYGGLL